MDKKKPKCSKVINERLVAAAYQAFEPNTIRQIIQLSFVSISTGLYVWPAARLPGRKSKTALSKSTHLILYTGESFFANKVMPF